MHIELWPIDRPIPYARNARKLSAAAIDKVAASIKEFGFRQPIVVDAEGVVIVGHTRLAAAKKLGWTDVPIHIATNLTPAQVKAYRLADNRTNEESKWDPELLSVEMAELRDLSCDLSLTAFDAREIDSMLADPVQDEEANAIPEPPAIPVTQPGDLWLLGPHRVVCGDSTDRDATGRTLARTAGKPQPNLMVTDPPYGVEYDASWRAEHDGGDRHATGKVDNDDRVDWAPAYALFPGNVMYLWHAGIYAGQVAAGIHQVGFDIRAQIIWAKQHFVFSRGAYHWKHEPCWYAVRKGHSANWCGDRTQSTVWDVPNANPHGGSDQGEQTGHSTQKPVEVMRRPILNHTQRGDAVYDPFLGSGTTLVACELAERVCYGLEINPAYVDVIVLRWQKLTGREAVLEANGQTFSEEARCRQLVAA